MKILVSSCLLGEDVRYDGENSAIAYNTSSSFSEKELFMDIICEHSIYSFCPEVSGGLNTPREAAEIISSNKPFNIQTKTGKNVTINFLLGAKNALDLCKEENITVALLKSKSPSCANDGIYDGTFNGKMIQGVGITTKLLEENGVRVFNENQINELAEYLNPKFNKLSLANSLKGLKL